MIVTTTETVAGQNVIATLGLVTGNTIRAKDAVRDVGASLKSLVGGELRSYTTMMVEARDEATQRMVADAQAMGADAVIGMRMTTSTVAGGASEILAYGTAVRLAGDSLPPPAPGH
ncbi:MAG: heavy metal-binding domain-containing protein [Actinomycetota bacterium]